MEKPKIILVVDDEIHNFDVIEAFLFKEKYILEHANNGREALNFLTKTQPDLILLDVMMPDLNGIEVCRRIKSNPHICHIPIVMATALNSKEDLANCLEAGADDFISKPISGLELRARVKSMLRIKQQYNILKETLQMRDDLSTMIVHDLRNPIGNITGASHFGNYIFLIDDKLKVTSSNTSCFFQNGMLPTLLLLANFFCGANLISNKERKSSKFLILDRDYLL
ncbi:MAG: response regulator [Pleurocapsa sp. MO_226.B13]|nr:response regulator [Pleurocapsa sp. MO_226.B13]